MRVSLTGWVTVAALAVVGAPPAPGEVGSDHAAAIVVYPYVTVDSSQGTDTFLQLSNTSNTPVVVRCLYDAAAIVGFPDACVVGAKDFHFTLTPQQPIGWRAGQGLATFPLDGVTRVGPGGAFNADSEIPPVEGDPYAGSLRCVAVDANFVPVERNVLIGTATLWWQAASSEPDAAQYTAIGFQAHAGAGNGDNTLVLGGANAEYDACPNLTVVTHFFDGAIEPVAEASSVSTTLVLVPCTQNFAFQIPGEAQVTYQVFNEFEQRFGTGQPMRCRQVSRLSPIGGAAPAERSIFSVHVAGTLTGQTRIHTVTGSGILALAIEEHHRLSNPLRTTRAAFHAHLIGGRDVADTLDLGSVSSPTAPPPSTATRTTAATLPPTAQSPTRTPTPTASATRTATPTGTLTAPPANTRTLTPSSTPGATMVAPSPTTAAGRSSGGCSLTKPQRATASPDAMLLVGMILLLLGRTPARRIRRLYGRGGCIPRLVVAALLALSNPAVAQVTTERSASILIFPHVIADGTSDTIIQIINQTRNTRHARCFYEEASPAPDDAPRWVVVDFEIFLTPLQPTHWVVSRGRVVDASDVRCGPEIRSCDGAGFDPGEVPAPAAGFRGELVCVEVDASGFPVPGNALIGKATLQQLESGDLVTYSAIGLLGFDSNNMDNLLCLGEGPSDTCPNGAEYAACPETWILNHPADTTGDPVADGGSAVTTHITVVPCTQDFQAQTAQPLTLQFLISNELEERFSASTTIACWADLPLTAIDAPNRPERSVFHRNTLGTDYVQTRITTIDPTRGMAIVAHTFYGSGAGESPVTSAATNVHSEGTSTEGDLITVVPAQ